MRTNEHARVWFNVMPYGAYQLYQAGRVKTDAERRQADIELGMRAAAVSRLWSEVTRPVPALRRYVRLHAGLHSWGQS
jgi:hypothetical protein